MVFSYMSIIRRPLVDAPFHRAYQYDQQFRLQIEQNQTRTWSQIDGNLWLQYIGKGGRGNISFCLNILAWSASVWIHQKCATNLSKIRVRKFHTQPLLLQIYNVFSIIMSPQSIIE
jgi:hypothetical protein